MPDINTKLNALKVRIQRSSQSAGRNLSDIQILAVSKGQPTKAIQQAQAAGLKDFGENYLQEALEKISALKGEAVTWHFLGPIQSNKAKEIALNFNWVQSICRLKIATLLNNYRPSTLPPLNICIQVNIDDDANKTGLKPSEVIPFAEEVLKLNKIKLRGLMTILKQSHNPTQEKSSFAKCKQLFNELNARGYNLDTLSMGMSQDLESAIAEGSTMVRIGTDLFGHRGEKNA